MAEIDDGAVAEHDRTPVDGIGGLSGDLADANSREFYDSNHGDPTDPYSREYFSYLADAGLFIDSCLIIDDAQGHGGMGGTMPFKLWPAQAGVVWALMSERLCIVLKARQLGISWICCGYVLWRCLFKSGQMILLFSRGQDEANELLRRVRVLYERMPEWLKERCPLAKPPNTSEMEWANNSRVKSLPATRHAGSGWTASLVIMDEAAKIQFASDLYTALKPTIDGGGQLAIISTANGIGNLFHNLWSRAAAGDNSFKTIFLPWWARPGRDWAWYGERIKEESDPQRVKQEYPSSANEAFMVSGRPRFDPDWIAAQAENVWDQGLPGQLLTPALRAIQTGLTVYELPVAGRRYQIGADVAEGLEKRDFSDAVVIDVETWEEVAILHGRWEPDEFAGYLQVLSDVYDAPVAVERNNHGHAVLTALKFLKCYRISKGHDDKPGWHTNILTKPQMIDLLAVALRDGLIKVRTQAALDEMQIYQIQADGKTEAPSGYFDDRVMSRAIALSIIARPNVSYVLGAAVPIPLEHGRPAQYGRPHATDVNAEWSRNVGSSRGDGGGMSGSMLPELPAAPAAPEFGHVAPTRGVDVGGRGGRRNFYGR